MYFNPVIYTVEVLGKNKGFALIYTTVKLCYYILCLNITKKTFT